MFREEHYGKIPRSAETDAKEYLCVQEMQD